MTSSSVTFLPPFLRKALTSVWMRVSSASGSVEDRGMMPSFRSAMRARTTLHNMCVYGLRIACDHARCTYIKLSISSIKKNGERAPFWADS